jgi:hypothetical protein
MMAEAWLSFPLFILHPCMDLSMSDAGRERVSSQPLLLLHEVELNFLLSAESRNADFACNR